MNSLTGSLVSMWLRVRCTANSFRIFSKEVHLTSKGLVDEALVDKELEVKERSVRRNKSYPIGTTAVLKIAERKSFLFVAAITDLQTGKAYANVSMMWKALEGLWQTVRASSDGGLISMPLVGGGQIPSGTRTTSSS